MRYYIYLQNTTNTPHGEYNIELYEDDNYLGKNDFYKKCIADGDDNDNNDDDWRNPNNGVEIHTIEIDINDEINAYYFDGYGDDYHYELDNNDAAIYFLGKLRRFYDLYNENDAKYFEKILKKRNITRNHNEYVLIINNKNNKIYNIDQEALF